MLCHWLTERSRSFTYSYVSVISEGLCVIFLSVLSSKIAFYDCRSRFCGSFTRFYDIR
jgi:hypothetical protein